MNNQDKFYVVTRNGRRVEEKDYWTKDRALKRADSLITTLKKWKDKDKNKVEVVETEKPHLIK
jgi:hypothetical protein